jgi:hypothetical protein
MAVSTLARQSEDKYARQAYQRHLDDIYYYNKEKYEYEQKLADKDRQIAELKAHLGEE